MSVELPNKRRRRHWRGSPKLRVAGRIVSHASMEEYEGVCWICHKRVFGWWYGLHWAGKWWCYKHHPLRPLFNQSWAEREGTSHRDRDRHERKVDAALGRKKRKPAKKRKRSRDRGYVR